MTPSAPRVGDVVHYVSYGTPGNEYRPACRAAVVTEVSSWVESATDQPSVGLCVLNPTGVFFRTLDAGGCSYHPGDVGHDVSGAEVTERSYPGGTWHRPERGA